ncbi:membrane fusion protein of efflux pump [Escherichia coli]|nr:membrane fusion protein of efflux pump [Escherichia coli]
MVDLSDVYMTFFLPTDQAGTLKPGGEARLILDASPDLRSPATIRFVARHPPFPPKTPKTIHERANIKLRVQPSYTP